MSQADGNPLQDRVRILRRGLSMGLHGALAEAGCDWAEINHTFGLKVSG